MSYNYEDKLWALIYEQYDQFSGRGTKELNFYMNELQNVKGKCLEIGCGTGIKLLQMLQNGTNIFGFDISKEMLEILIEKAKQFNLSDVSKRISTQNMVDFKYSFKFDAVIIPNRSFLHNVSQAEQISTLRNIYNHLTDSGKLMLNFFQPKPSVLIQKMSQFEHFADFSNPLTKEPISLYYKENKDILNQIINIEWKFKTLHEEHLTNMKVKWIYKSEFELLLKLVGFKMIEVFGDFDKNEVQADSRELVWIASKT
jgi:ubiquinone/menaquinone biosynthesis C-methylase UbiE